MGWNIFNLIDCGVPRNLRIYKIDGVSNVLSSVLNSKSMCLTQSREAGNVEAKFGGMEETTVDCKQMKNLKRTNLSGRILSLHVIRQGRHKMPRHVIVQIVLMLNLQHCVVLTTTRSASERAELYSKNRNKYCPCCLFSRACSV